MLVFPVLAASHWARLVTYFSLSVSMCKCVCVCVLVPLSLSHAVTETHTRTAERERRRVTPVRTVKLPAFGTRGMINNECVCACLSLARAFVRPSNPPAERDGWRSSPRQLLPRRPGSSSSSQFSSLKAGRAGHAWAWEGKAAKATRFCSEPWRNHNDSCGSGRAPLRAALYLAGRAFPFHRRHTQPAKSEREKGQCYQCRA